MFTRRLLFVLAVVSLLSMIGCRDPKITSYRVRKEAPPRMPLPMSDGSVPQLHWKAPADWKEEAAGSVRIASFSLVTSDGRKAEMAVTQFPGDVGGDLANVNRWRGQIQLAPVSEADLPTLVKTVDLPAGTFSTVDFVSEKPIIDEKYHSRILGAWLKQPERTWFFKLAGEADLVSAQHQAFQDFLNSVEIAAAIATPAAPASTDSPTHATPSDTNSLTRGANQAVTWTAPSTWTSKPLGTMRKGSYALHGLDGIEADLSIISFPGEAGGMAENLNRWRTQIQLPALEPEALAKSAITLANGGLRFTVVDYAGTTTNGATRVVGAILPLENETYFFKLMGPDAVVSEHKQSFLDFLKTVKAR